MLVFDLGRRKAVGRWTYHKVFVCVISRAIMVRSASEFQSVVRPKCQVIDRTQTTGSQMDRTS